MKNKLLVKTGTFLVAILFVLSVTAGVMAQGRGRGGGVGGGRGSGVGQPTGVGVGNPDRGRAIGSDRSNGRADTGLERARLARENMNNANRELRRHPNIASDIHVNANDLRADYQVALAANPNLTFGQFVAATRLAHNLGDTNPGITRSAILAGLANGDSLGRTLRNLGLGKDEANAAVKRAENEIKNSKRRS